MFGSTERKLYGRLRGYVLALFRDYLIELDCSLSILIINLTISLCEIHGILLLIAMASFSPR